MAGLLVLAVFVLVFGFLVLRFPYLPKDKQKEVLTHAEVLIKQFSDKYYYNETWQKDTREGRYENLKMRSF